MSGDLTATMTLLFASHSAEDMANAIAASLPAATKWDFLRALDDAHLFVPVYTISPDWVKEALDDQNEWNDPGIGQRRIKPGSEQAVFNVLNGWDIDDKIYEAMSYVRDDVIKYLEENKLIETIPEEVTTEGE